MNARVQGYCSICGTQGPLTADHVPPKGAVGISARDLRTLTQYLAVDTNRPKIYQNGVKFPTLCAVCNNDRLGSKYDPTLNEFSKSLANILRVKRAGTLEIPDPIRLTVKPHRIARAIIGHLLAIAPQIETSSPPLSAPFPDAMRSYFLDSNAALPDEIDIYYWLYPSDLHVAARGFGFVSDVRSSKCIVGDLIKFYPVGYWVTYEKPASAAIKLPELVTRKNAHLDDEDDLRINTSNVPALGWPERPGSWGANMLDDGMTFVAYRRQTRRQRRARGGR